MFCYANKTCMYIGTHDKNDGGSRWRSVKHKTGIIFLRPSVLVAHNKIITLTSWQYGFFFNFLWNVLYNIKITIARPLTRAHSLNCFVVSCNLDGRMSLDNKLHYIQLLSVICMYIHYISVYGVIYITINLCIRFHTMLPFILLLL